MDAESSGTPLIFDRFVIDPREKELRVEGQRVRIGLRAFDLLMVLVERNGHLVSKDELLDLVWPKMVVEENTLQVHISTLRKLLGSEVIVTVPGRGYRFTARAHDQAQATQSPLVTHGLATASTELPGLLPAGPTGTAQLQRGITSRRAWKVAALGGVVAAIASAAWFWGRYTDTSQLKEAAGLTAPPEKSIAVLPFVDMSEKRDQEYFSDGLSEDLIDRLTQSPDLKVIARTSAFAFKGKNEDIRTIATKLGVANLLEGSVRRSGKLMRITAQLIRASDGMHLWSQSYDRNVTDIFKIQDEIAVTVAGALKAALQATYVEPRSDNLEAFNLYLKGEYFSAHLSKENTDHAIEYFKKAIDLDPNYASAWAGLAMSYVSSVNSGWMSPAEASKNTRYATERALKLNPNLYKPFISLGTISAIVDWDWEAARRFYRRALELNPNSLVAVADLAEVDVTVNGRDDELLLIEKKMIERDPLDVASLNKLSVNYFYSGHFEEAVAIGKQAILLDSRYAGAYAGLAFPLLYLGRLDEALAAAQKESDKGWRLMTLPIVYWALGRKVESAQALREVETKYADGGAFNIAEVHAYRGEADSAFQWLERAYRQRDPGMTVLRIDPLLQNIRMDPRYHELLVRMRMGGAPPPSLH